MRTIVILSLLGVLGACTVSAGTNPPANVEPNDASSVDPAYCSKFCQAAENGGTLMGTLQDCLNMCCSTVPNGCQQSPDGAVIEPDATADGAREAGGDGGTESGCAMPCGTTCCTGTEACVKDAMGQSSCQNTCTTSTDCPPASPCCAVQSNGSSVCVGSSAGQQCRCTTAADCKDTGCCAPLTDAKGDPIGPYVCKPNDANAYDCCTGLTNFCGTGFCCVADSNGNEFCATECQNDTMCGGGHCKMYDFSHTTCSGPTACGP